MPGQPLKIPCSGWVTGNFLYCKTMGARHAQPCHEEFSFSDETSATIVILLENRTNKGMRGGCCEPCRPLCLGDTGMWSRLHARDWGPDYLS